MRRIIIPLALAAVIAAITLWHVHRKGEANHLVLSGSIEARDAEIGSLIAGRVEKVLVDEGALVHAGQPIAILESNLILPQVSEQEASVAQAKAALERALHGPAKEELMRARINSEAAETDRRRMEGLLQSGAVAQQDYDAAAVKAGTTKETLEELEHGTRPEDIAAARAVLSQKEQRLEYLRRQLQETQIVAPADGVIESIDLRRGDLVEAGRPVAKLLEPSELWVRVYVPEPRLGLVKIGQDAWVSVDTWPKKKFPGRVVEISDRAEYTPRNVQTIDQRNDQVFGVKVTILPTTDLKPGMAAFVTLAEDKAK